MDLLGSVKYSVIWLLVDTAAARARLRRCAAAKGIDSRRIIFADRCSREQHLARHACADLFLDTWPCGVHTTASDALGGLPINILAAEVPRKGGGQFSARAQF
jgi:predicted O-linked N-acetylglucosamine transferase (SPINDLY family)